MLEGRDITGGYGQTTVLRHVDIAVADGSVVALLGPNGAGKTTMLNILSGQLRAQLGSVRLDGQEIGHTGADRRARLGICHIPEGRGIFRTLSVRENLALFAPDGDVERARDFAVDAFPALGRRMQLEAGKLSGGEQQMLALTRCYLADPRVVLVDEASLGLAPVVVDQLFEFLRRMTQQGKALLLVEQYVDRALELADHVYLLNQGEVVMDRPKGEISSEEIFDRYLSIEVAVESP